MKSGTQSSRLTLVDSRGRELAAGPDDEDLAVEFSRSHMSDEDENPSVRPVSDKGKLIVLAAVAIACATAALATGSYAVWLSRKHAAREALTDVQEILRTCQDRMSQMESDLQRLPKVLSSGVA